jgi:peptidoglycan hydrolase-like protein with peptidoglycan-binding domain
MLRKLALLSTALAVATFFTAAAPSAQAAAYDPLVYRAQVALAQKGFDAGPPDGKMGPRTSAAITAYQRANGMAATGQVNQSLIAQLEGSNARVDRPRRDAPRDLDRSGDGRRLSQSELISQTQAELRRLGYGITFVGGRLNGETSDAIRDYQQRRGLEPTGMPSRQLLAQMRRDSSNVMGRGISAPLPPPSYPSYPNSYPSYPAQTYPVAPTEPVKCADWLHQSRPGGSNYEGPPVPGCPSN